MGHFKINSDDLIKVVTVVPDLNGQVSIGRKWSGKNIRIYVELLEEKNQNI